MNSQLISVVVLSSVSLSAVPLGVAGSPSRAKYIVEDVQILCDSGDDLLYDDGDTVFTEERRRL